MGILEGKINLIHFLFKKSQCKLHYQGAGFKKGLQPVFIKWTVHNEHSKLQLGCRAILTGTVSSLQLHSQQEQPAENATTFSSMQNLLYIPIFLIPSIISPCCLYHFFTMLK